MKAPFSAYLNGIAPKMQEIVDALGKDYDYVSLLSTDSVGFSVGMSQRNKSVTNETMTTERGAVVLVEPVRVDHQRGKEHTDAPAFPCHMSGLSRF